MLTRDLRAAAVTAIAVGVLGGLLPTGHASAAPIAAAPITAAPAAAAAKACNPDWVQVPGEQKVGAYCVWGTAGWITASITCISESTFKQYTRTGNRLYSDMSSDAPVFMSFASCRGVDAYVTGRYILG